MTNMDESDNDNDSFDNVDNLDFGDGLETGGVVIEDLSWRVEKLRLEEQNKQRFLKARPRFLPYDDCRRWVQAFGRWESAEDWHSWIAMGEKRNSYIPSRPDEYYGRLNQWISWEHFLKIPPQDDDNNNQSKESNDEKQ